MVDYCYTNITGSRWFFRGSGDEQVDGLAEDVGGTIPGVDITGAGAWVVELWRMAIANS